MPTDSRPRQPRAFTRPTVRLLLRARRALTIAAGLTLVQLRRSSDAGRALAALVQEPQVTISRLEEENCYLRDRLGRMPPRHRTHYTPAERFRIVVFTRTYGLSLDDAAHRFLVTPATLSRWLKEAAGAPTRQAIGTLIRATPPVRRYADVVRNLVQAMEVWGFGGSRRIAQTLARAGVRLGRETVRRYRHSPRRVPPAPCVPHGPLVARRPNHVWLIDVRHLQSLFRLFPLRILARARVRAAARARLSRRGHVAATHAAIPGRRAAVSHPRTARGVTRARARSHALNPGFVCLLTPAGPLRTSRRASATGANVTIPLSGEPANPNPSISMAGNPAPIPSGAIQPP
jgi:hypothetical protein